MAIVTTDDQNYKDIANAIRERNGTSNTYKPREMPLAIRSISGSGSSIKFQSNKTVTPTESTQYVQPDSGYDGLQQVTVNPIPSDYQDTSDATAVSSDLLEGKVAYGSSGRIVGSLVPSSGDGVDTSDANATASDIVAPKTAYVASGKVTGTLEEESSLSYTNGSAAYNSFGVPAIMITKTITDGRHLIKNNGMITVSSLASNFGNALPSDVAEGKTFTSSSGFKVTGTKTDSGSSGSGGNLIRYGQTTSAVINTGLSSIIVFAISATATATGLGLCQATYNSYDDETHMSMTYCNSSSQYMKMYAYTTVSTDFSISGGTFEWTGTDSRAFQSGMEYQWFAVGS